MTFTALLATVLAISTPCQTEDSTNCRWDADVQGNGTGVSFVGYDNATYYEGGLVIEGQRFELYLVG